jgi:hypothetical protein
MKFFIYLAIFVSILFSRENPFEPLVSSDTKVVIEKEEFASMKMSLPDSARVLKSITLNYQNMDGSINKKSVDINKEIDWHYPINISQTREKVNFQEVSFNFIKFYIRDKKIFINTSDRKERDFFLINPYKFVIDFRANRAFSTYTRPINKSFIKRVILGNHKGFYRVVFLLDGRYSYSVKKVKEGYLIDFK